MNIVKPGFEREIYRKLQLNKMRKLLNKIDWQFSLDYLLEAKTNMNAVLDLAKGTFDEEIGYRLASLYFKIGENKQALKAISYIQPPEMQKVPRVLNLKGMCCLKINKLKEATELFEMSILLDPTFVNGMNNLGNLAMHNKDYDKCKLYYMKSKESTVN